MTYIAPKRHIKGQNGHKAVQRHRVATHKAVQSHRVATHMAGPGYCTGSGNKRSNKTKCGKAFVNNGQTDRRVSITNSEKK